MKSKPLKMLSFKLTKIKIICYILVILLIMILTLKEHFKQDKEILEPFLELKPTSVKYKECKEKCLVKYEKDQEKVCKKYNKKL